MATVKIILRKKHNKDGSVKLNKDETLPLTMRITKDTKTNFIYLGYGVLEKDWDEQIRFGSGLHKKLKQ